MSLHIIVDADPIVYRAGFASETRNYSVVFETQDGEMVEKLFCKDTDTSAGAKKKAFKEEHPSWEVVSDVLTPDVEPLEFCLTGVKLTLRACIRDAVREYNTAHSTAYTVESSVVSLLLTGKGNFREGVATILPYKGNRADVAKPVHYQAIRDYLCRSHDAKMIEGWEADDECSILGWRAYAKNTPAIVCTIDKDLDQIPVPHYDYAKKVYYEVDEDEGNYLFHKQCLTGDSTDNIQGMFRMGAKGAEKLLEKWSTEYSEEPTYETWDAYVWRHTVEQYAANMEKYPDKFPEGMAPEDAAIETARLVFMQQHHYQLWTPPGQPDKELNHA